MKQPPISSSGQTPQYWTTANQHRLMTMAANTDECLIQEAQQVVADGYSKKTESEELLPWFRRLVADD